MISPAVRAVHILLEPGLKVSQLVLCTVHHLHSCSQVSTSQAVIDQSPHRMALHLTILFPHTHTGSWSFRLLAFSCTLFTNTSELRSLFAHAGKISHFVIYGIHRQTLVCDVEGCAAVMVQYLHAWQRAGKLDVEEAVHKLISARYST